MDLFTVSNIDKNLECQDQQFLPLAERLRPRTLNEFVGQNSFAAQNSGLLKSLREHNFLPNLILWGPPGTGKTTFAYLLSQEVKAHFVSCNAIDTGAKDLREIGLSAHRRRVEFKEKTLVFVDEIHRLNKSQQDVLLPFTERGDIVLIGATTENPSYELNSALLSRAKVLVFERLSAKDLMAILVRAAKLYNTELAQIFLDETLDAFIVAAAGDARQALNQFEILVNDYLTIQGPETEKSYSLTTQAAAADKSYPLTIAELQLKSQSGYIRYDKKGDQHYDSISAFIKSVRGSDPDAAIYYLACMLHGGEDPVFIARRLVILASEDIGNADPRALPLAVSALQAVELIGMPEARISLAQATTYLASAPKSNRSYLAINEALDVVKNMGALPIPKSLRSAQTRLMRDLGHGEGYKYSHDYARGFADQQFLPDAIQDKKFYEPSQHGFEKNIAEYLNWLKKK